MIGFFFLCGGKWNETRPFLQPSRDSVTLREHLEAVQQRHADLCAIEASRRKELEQLRNELHELYAELDTEIEGAFASIGDSLSLGRVTEFQQRILAQQSEKTQRLNRINRSIAQIQSLWAEMVIETHTSDLAKQIAGESDELPPQLHIIEQVGYNCLSGYLVLVAEIALLVSMLT